MNSIEQLKLATSKAKELAAAVAGRPTDDAVEARRTELEAMTHEELVAHALGLEKVKNDKGYTIEDVAKALLEDPDCAIFTYDQIASTIREATGSKTTGKGIASYVMGHKEDWNVQKRVKFRIDPADLLAA